MRPVPFVAAHPGRRAVRLRSKLKQVEHRGKLAIEADQGYDGFCHGIGGGATEIGAGSEPTTHGLGSIVIRVGNDV